MWMERGGEEDQNIGGGVIASDMKKVGVSTEDAEDRVKWKCRQRVGRSK